MKKFILTIFLMFSWFCTSASSTGLVYLGLNMALGIGKIIGKDKVRNFALKMNSIIQRSKVSNLASSTKQENKIENNFLTRDQIHTLIRERGFTGKYKLVIKNQCVYGPRVDIRFNQDEEVTIFINKNSPPCVIHHEVGHMLQSQSRYMPYQFLLPYFIAGGVHAALPNRSLIFSLGSAVITIAALIRQVRLIEGEADDLIPTDNTILREQKTMLQRALKNLQSSYETDKKDRFLSKTAIIGKRLLNRILPKSLGMPLWEALFYDIEHPGRQYSIDRLEKRIAGTLDTTPKPAKPPLLSNNTFRVAETTGILYGLAAQTLYTFTGAEKTLQLMAPLTEKLVSSLASKAVDAVQNKLSKKISSVFNKPA